MPPGNRLQHPLLADVERVDYAASRTAGSYDDVFRTHRPGTAPTYLEAVTVKAQVEMGQWEARNQREAGDTSDSRVVLIFHYRDLKKLGLVDAETGEALFRKGDRLTRLRERRTGKSVQLVREGAGGLYATKVEPGGLGLAGKRNLLVVTYEERPRGLTGAAG